MGAGKVLHEEPHFPFQSAMLALGKSEGAVASVVEALAGTGWEGLERSQWQEGLGTRNCLILRACEQALPHMGASAAVVVSGPLRL